MNTEQRRKAKEVFIEAAVMPAADRPGFLNAACESDGEVRAEVDSLLAAKALPSLSSWAGGVLGPRGGGMVGRRVGNFVVKSLIGEGGMGIVYEAEQEQPRRTVALKMMRTGIASTSALRRFREESQTLARLEHAGIARIYESGVHESDGEQVPYFAMEFIAGARPITEFARDKGLSTREKLILFAAVCDAVQHGHQKGIIHRDLKPQNILVGSDGVPRVIDFGVARSIGSDQPVTTLHTGVGQLIGTLLYMSPEQLDADAHDVDTRSDVYALGVVLYELLAGRRPYDVGSSTLPQAVKAMWEQTPARLSGIDRRLRGDLETITLKAMDKDRKRRYQSAAELGEDVRRYLSNKPITARPATFRYQVRMFVRGHKAVSASVSAAVLGLVMGLVVSLVSMAHALSARSEAASARNQEKAVADFFVEFLKTQDPADPGWSRESFLAALNLAVTNLDQRMSEGELPRVLRTITEVLHNNARFTEAEALAERVLEMEKAIHPGKHADVATSLAHLARAKHRLGRAEEAVELQTQAVNIFREVHRGDHVTVALHLRFLGYMIEKRAETVQAEGQQSLAESLYKLAEERYTHSLAMRERLVNANHPDVEKHLDHIGADRSRLHSGDDPEVATTWHSLGWVRHALGRDDDAEKAFQDAAKMNSRLCGNRNPGAAHHLTTFADHLVRECKKRDPARAEGLYVTALVIQEEAYGRDHQDRANTMADLARCRSALGRPSEALLAAQDAAEMATRLGLPEGDKTRTKCDEVLAEIGGASAASSPLRSKPTPPPS